MTQHYVGTKIIEAWPAQKDGTDGYSVKYADGYISWSPKDAFDAAYLPLHVPAGGFAEFLQGARRMSYAYGLGNGPFACRVQSGRQALVAGSL